MDIPKNKKIYFASDQHFGSPSLKLSKEREMYFLEWLDKIQKDAFSLFLLGDLFDFWFEYNKVVPKGFVRVLGKLANFTDNGISVHFFVGNHDLWMKDYFEKELNISVHFNPEDFVFNNKKFFLGHGDGLGSKDTGYKLMKKIFTNKLAQRAFRILHPDLGIRMGQYFSSRNKKISSKKDSTLIGDDNKNHSFYISEKLKQEHFDFFIFGHLHKPLEINLNSKSKYINLGDWISHFTYGSFDGTKLELKKWEIK